VGAKGKKRRVVPAFLRRGWATLSALPRPVQAALATVAAIALAFALNWAYQVVRKPAELFFPLSGVLSKTPEETWRQYGPIFRQHATHVVAPELLAALAQAEGSGNPVAQTYWRWKLSAAPTEIYRPASSAVGMYQITNGTFDEARRLCIHDHQVVEDGPWNDWRSCWFNSLYLRVVPSHSAEMTSAYLHRRATETLGRLGLPNATPRQKQDLAAVIHLCGAGAGVEFARRRFRARPGQRCGDHELERYLEKVNALVQLFLRYSRANDA
jgi:hypothetical protein